LEEVPDAAGQVALEAADGFAVGFAFGGLAGEVGHRHHHQSVDIGAAEANRLALVLASPSGV
jgi:hypothetical protein